MVVIYSRIVERDFWGEIRHSFQYAWSACSNATYCSHKPWQIGVIRDRCASWRTTNCESILLVLPFYRLLWPHPGFAAANLSQSGNVRNVQTVGGTDGMSKKHKATSCTFWFNKKCVRWCTSVTFHTWYLVLLRLKGVNVGQVGASILCIVAKARFRLKVRLVTDERGIFCSVAASPAASTVYLY